VKLKNSFCLVLVIILLHSLSLPIAFGTGPEHAEDSVDKKPLFEIIGGPEAPVLDEGMRGTQDIRGGFEGGLCLKVGEKYHMFPTERVGRAGEKPFVDDVNTRFGHWTSPDAVHWTRRSTIFQSTGKYAVAETDNPLNDRRGALYAFMPVYDEKLGRWYGYYVAYTVYPNYTPMHSYGRIWRAESVKRGIHGIGGPYRDVGIIMEPGLDTQPWEGRQGVDSFCPFPTGDGWLGFYGGAFPYARLEDYPKKTGKGWLVGLAKAQKLEGPWIRLKSGNPVRSIHPEWVENPIVSRLPNGVYIAIFDGGPGGWGYGNTFGYSLSKDGINWTRVSYIQIHTKVKKWWRTLRTPLCLVAQGNDIYTVLYTAMVKDKRFRPIGLVRLKLDREVLEARTKDLK
jgi:hypothetical protein